MACWWCILAVDGGKSVVKLLGVGEFGVSPSGLRGWPVLCCQLNECLPININTVKRKRGGLKTQWHV